MTANKEILDQTLYPSLFRRLAAITYDALLLVAIVFIAFMPVPMLPQAFRDSLAGKISLQAYILLILFIFFGWFWTHRGQTLGMRAWRLKIVSHDGKDISWIGALKRFVLAFFSVWAFGLGFILCLFHKQKMAFHDMYSDTKLVLVEKNLKSKAKKPAAAKQDPR